MMGRSEFGNPEMGELQETIGSLARRLHRAIQRRLGRGVVLEMLSGEAILPV